MAPTLLAKDVHVCVADRSAIFLDLRRDRYVGLDGPQTAVLYKIISNEPDACADVDPLITHLSAQGLLTHDAGSGRALRLTEALSPTAGLIGFEYDPPCEVRWHHVISLAAAYFEVTASLRFRSLAVTVATASRRRQAAENRSAPLDVEFVRAQVLAFRRLRPLFYKGRLSCLFDSLVLACFLAKYGVSSNVIIGVMLGPFSGHCWVQYETLVLNDRLERVAKFTPILSS